MSGTAHPRGTSCPHKHKHITYSLPDTHKRTHKCAQVLLKALYSRYRLKPPGGGLRTKSVKMDGWLQLMSDAHLVDGQFTLQV